MNLTDEQKVIIDCSGDAKIHAVAGSGKTSTLIELAKSRGKNVRTLYLAFNRSVKSEAQVRFSDAQVQNIRIETVHWNGVRLCCA
jgi:F-box protein 18 (helicase)